MFSPNFADPACMFYIDLFDSTAPADWPAVTGQTVELPWRTPRAEAALEAGGYIWDFIRRLLFHIDLSNRLRKILLLIDIEIHATSIRNVTGGKDDVPLLNHILVAVVTKFYQITITVITVIFLHNLYIVPGVVLAPPSNC